VPCYPATWLGTPKRGFFCLRAADWARFWWLRVGAEARVLRPADPERDDEVAAAVEALRGK